MSVAWSQRWSLKGIATILVSEEPWDDWLPWVQERQQFMKKVMDYGFEMLANRCPTFSKYPERYSKLLSAPGPDSTN